MGPSKRNYLLSLIGRPKKKASKRTKAPTPAPAPAPAHAPARMHSSPVPFFKRLLTHRSRTTFPVHTLAAQKHTRVLFTSLCDSPSTHYAY